MSTSFVVNLFLIIGTALVVVFFYWVVTGGQALTEAEKIACGKLGMTRIASSGNDYCVNLSDIYLVDFDCEEIRFKEWTCQPKILTRGFIG